jgi:hypothetical protein
VFCIITLSKLGPLTTVTFKAKIADGQQDAVSFGLGFALAAQCNGAACGTSQDIGCSNLVPFSEVFEIPRVSFKESMLFLKRFRWLTEIETKR